MGLIESLSGWWKARAANPGPQDNFWYGDTPYIFRAGVRINPTTAMRITAVYACVRVLSDGIGSLPAILYQRTDDNAKTRAQAHPLYNLLRFQPNHYQTAYEFWEQVVRCCALRGFFYAQIVMGRDGQVLELLPLHPDRVILERLVGERYRYRYTNLDGREQIFSPEELFRVMYYTEEDGMTPISPIKANADSVGITEAAERYASSYFGNASAPGGVMESDAAISPESRNAIRESWERMHRGPDNAGRVAVLGNGLKYKQLAINTKDSQLLETRQFQLTDIARIFRVPPHLIQDLSRSTFSNIEHQSLDFVTYTIRPWARRIEQAISRDLLLKTEMDEFFAEFLVKDLLAADAKARAEANASGIQNGYITRNEARVSEGLNPLPDLDEPLMPSNLRGINEPLPQPGAETKPPGQQSTSKGNSDE